LKDRNTGHFRWCEIFENGSCKDKSHETSAHVFGRRKLIFREEVKLIFQKLTITP